MCSCPRLPPVSPGRYLPADQQQTSVSLHLPGRQSYLGQAEHSKTTRKFWRMLCLFSRMNLSLPALHLAYATHLLANHAAGWAGCLQLQICFLLTRAIHELVPIMVREASLHRTGKTQTYAEIHCMLPLFLLLAWCPITIILTVISMALTLLFRMGRVLHSIFLYLWRAGSSRGATSSFICSLSTALGYRVLENNCSKPSLFMGLNVLLLFTWHVCEKMINVHLIFLPYAASWANVCAHQFSQLVLMGLK